MMCEGVIRMILGVDEFIEKFRDKSHGKERRRQEFLGIKNKKDFSIRFDNIDKQLADEGDCAKKRTKEIINGSLIGDKIPDNMFFEVDEDFIKAREQNKLINQREEFNEVDIIWQVVKKTEQEKKEADVLSELEKKRKNAKRFGSKKL